MERERFTEESTDHRRERESLREGLYILAALVHVEVCVVVAALLDNGETPSHCFSLVCGKFVRLGELWSGGVLWVLDTVFLVS